VISRGLNTAKPRAVGSSEGLFPRLCLQPGFPCPPSLSSAITPVSLLGRRDTPMRAEGRRKRRLDQACVLSVGGVRSSAGWCLDTRRGNYLFGDQRQPTKPMAMCISSCRALLILPVRIMPRVKTRSVKRISFSATKKDALSLPEFKTSGSAGRARVPAKRLLPKDLANTLFGRGPPRRSCHTLGDTRQVALFCFPQLFHHPETGGARDLSGGIFSFGRPRENRDQARAVRAHSRKSPSTRITDGLTKAGDDPGTSWRSTTNRSGAKPMDGGLSA